QALLAARCVQLTSASHATDPAMQPTLNKRNLLSRKPVWWRNCRIFVPLGLAPSLSLGSLKSQRSPRAPVLTDALVGATNVWPRIVCVGTVPFAHRAATIGMTGGEAARGVKGCAQFETAA